MRPSPAITRYLQAQAQAMPPNQVRCQHCGQLVEHDNYMTIQRMVRMTPAHPAGVVTMYEGCVACLEQRLATAPSGLSLHTQMTLRQARRVITQPASEAEIEAAVQAIDAELKG